MMEKPETPECDKMRVVSEQSQIIGEFIDWLDDAKAIFLARYEPGMSELVHARENINRLLAEFFDIDLDKVEEEKMAILEYLRSQNDG